MSDSVLCDGRVDVGDIRQVSDQHHRCGQAARGAPAQAGMPSVPQRLQAPSQQVRRVSSRQVPPLGSLSGMSQHGHLRSPQPTNPGVGSTSAFGGGVGAGGGLGLGVPRGALAPLERPGRCLRGGLGLPVGGEGGGVGAWLLSKVQKSLTGMMFSPVHGVGPACSSCMQYMHAQSETVAEWMHLL